MSLADSVLFTPSRIGTLTIPNRFVRAGTAETMATDEGAVTPALVSLYERLASHNIGLIVTGHMNVHPRGKATAHQVGIFDDHFVDGLSEIPRAVHACGGRIFAQLGHAGTQSKVVERLLGPSALPNLFTGRPPDRAASEDEIVEAIESFARAAQRAHAAGFDGVHLHGANGYLISSFGSPHSNDRNDAWGGDRSRRSRFAVEVVRAVRGALPPGFPVTMKLGFVDAAPDGLELDEALERVDLVTAEGVDAIEVSSNLMASPVDSAKRFVGVGRARAFRDLIFERVEPERAPEAYFASYAAAVKQRSPGVRVILVGGLRSAAKMSELVDSGTADLLSMARPFIRQPDLVDRLQRGTSLSAACTSCNLCFELSATHSLRCWRKPRYRLPRGVVLRAARRRAARRG